MKIALPRRNPRDRARVHAQFDKIQVMIHTGAHPRDVNHELEVLSRLTRIRRERSQA